MLVMVSMIQLKENRAFSQLLVMVVRITKTFLMQHVKLLRMVTGSISFRTRNNQNS